MKLDIPLERGTCRQEWVRRSEAVVGRMGNVMFNKAGKGRGVGTSNTSPLV